MTIAGKEYKKDSWYNTPETILSAVNKSLHVQRNHPLSITRQLIESRFPTFTKYNDYFPVVSTHQNFDSLGFPKDHPGRSRSDTYYINSTTLLRTHTSAHEAEVFSANETDRYLISADVYRRDAVDRTHYPIFHQMEGARFWDRKEHSGNVTNAVLESLASLPTHDMKVENPSPTVHADNPLQPEHTLEEVEAISAHLKRSLENVVVEIFSKAREAAAAAGDPTAHTSEPLKVRFIEAYFPFTSPSWEVEIYWQGQWLEILGCGVTRQSLYNNAGFPDRLGWAFGIGLERIAMLLFNIPDIRLFWSQDSRFLNQFNEAKPIQRFAPFSKHPECYKDVSFWLPSSTPTSSVSAAGGGGSIEGVGGVVASGEEKVDNSTPETPGFHENDVMEIVRDVAGDLAEDVQLADEFTHPKTKRRSLCYRINYRSLERTLTNEEVNEMHKKIESALVEKLGVQIR